MLSKRQRPAVAAPRLLALMAPMAAASCAGGHHHGREAQAGHHTGEESSSGHHHSFADAEKWAKRFEADGRDAWQQPDRVIEWLALEPTMTVADIGSATGYFPVRIARVVEDGRVWGVDLEPDMVRYLNARARREGLSNLVSVRGSVDDPLLPEPVDRILMVNTYHHVSNRPAYFRRLLPFLREDGRIVVVDFRMGQIPVGPPERMRIEPEQVIFEMKEAGLAHLSTHELPYQYVLTFGRDR